MKHLLMVTASLILVSCGNMNHHRSGKLRKVRVNRSADSEQVVEVKKEKKKRGYNIQLSEDEVLHNETIVEEKVAYAGQEELGRADCFVTDVDNSRSFESEKVQEQMAFEAEEKVVRKERKRSQKVQGKELKRAKGSRIDWYDIGYYSLVVLVIGAIIAGLIFYPIITLTILVIALVLAIIAIFSAIFSFFFDIFDMFLG
ncbi:MAG: hypothetical protein Crog4KO_26900 [Crocinitomicaceae bacterium]